MPHKHTYTQIRPTWGGAGRGIITRSALAHVPCPPLPAGWASCLRMLAVAGHRPLVIAALLLGIPARHLSLAYMQHAPALTTSTLPLTLALGAEMVRLVCMIDQRWLTRLKRLGRKPTCARIVRSLPSRPSPPRREPVLFCLALSIVRRPHRKHQTFPRWRHDNSVTGFKAGRAGYHALPALHQDVILQLIHGMERRIHPVSPCAGPSAPRLNPGTQRRERCGLEKPPLRSAQTRSMQSSPPPQASSPMWRAWLGPRNIGRWPQSTPDLAASPSSVPSRATGLRTGQTELHPPKRPLSFFFFFNF